MAKAKRIVVKKVVAGRMVKGKFVRGNPRRNSSETPFAVRTRYRDGSTSAEYYPTAQAAKKAFVSYIKRFRKEGRDLGGPYHVLLVINGKAAKGTQL
jgi:hypothetical protein